MDFINLKKALHFIGANHSCVKQAIGLSNTFSMFLCGLTIIYPISYYCFSVFGEYGFGMEL